MKHIQKMELKLLQQLNFNTRKEIHVVPFYKPTY
jgi:hypothetical protein